MKKARLLFTMCFAILLFNISDSYAEQPLTIYYFPRPPLYITEADGKAGGFLIEIVKNIMKEAGVPHLFKEIPTKRILMNIQQEEYSCGIGWFKNPEREKFAIFSVPIYIDGPIVAIFNKEKAGAINQPLSLEQLFKSKLVLGVIEGFSYGSWVDEAITKFKPQLSVVNGEQIQLIKMILFNRHDYSLMGIEEATWILANDPEFKAELTIVGITDAPPGNIRYLMYSKGVDQKTIQRIDQAISAFVRTETYKRLTAFVRP